MLDWFTGNIGYDASNLEVGRIIRIDPNGVKERDSPTWEKAVGSHEASCQVSTGFPTETMLQYAHKQGQKLTPSSTILRVSGNPVKFLQGHNVFGPSVSNMGPILQTFVRKLPDGLRPVNAHIEELQPVHRSVVDVNVSIDLGTHDAVHRWLHHAGKSTRSRHGRAVTSSGTVYWGKNSKRWALKAYCKHCELKSHKPHLEPQVVEELSKYATGLLRMELRLKRLVLAPMGTLSEDLIWDFWNKITIGIVREASEKKMSDMLKNAEKRTLQNWRAGYDPLATMSKPSFYRHRSAILKEIGVDISNPVDTEMDKDINREHFSVDYLRPRAAPKRVPRALEKYLLKVS